MGQTIWPLASDRQQYALAGVPKLTSFLSIMGSCYIIADIVRLKRRNTYHRILLGMNIVDLMSLIAWFFTTWPIPVRTKGVMGAVGNQATCDAQGFFSQLSIATVLYNVCLSIYFMLVIRHGWTEQRIAETKLEYYFHFLSVGVGIGTATIALVLELYNPAGWQCWIAVAPTGCAESWEWDSPSDHTSGATRRLQQSLLENLFTPRSGGTTNDTTMAPTSYTDIPCERGDNANLYVWFLFYFPLWASIIVASCCLYQVYAAYHAQDMIVEKWRQKLLMTATPVVNVAADAGKKLSGAATITGKKITGAATNTTNKLTDVAKRPFVTPNAKRKRTNTTTPIYTPAQKRKLEKEKQEQSTPATPNTATSNSAIPKGETKPMKDGSDSTSYHSARGRMDLSSSANSQSSSSSRRKRDPLPPVLGSKVYTGRTHHPKIHQLNNSATHNNTTGSSTSPKQNQKSRTHSYLPNLTLSRGRTEATADTNVRPRQQNVKSKLVTSQALLYLCSFYVAWLFTSIMRIQESTTAEGVAYYHWMFLSAFFCPLQGLMNFIVYIRPKYLAILRDRKREEARARQQDDLRKLRAHNSYYKKHYKNNYFGADKNTLTAGSSSALMTIESDRAVAGSQELTQTPLSGNNISSHHIRRGEKDTIAVVGGLPSSNETDDGSSHEGSNNVDALVVWNESDLAAMEAGEDHDEIEVSSLHDSRAVMDLFDALTAHERTHEATCKVVPRDGRPKFNRSNSSNSNFLSMRPVDGQILTDDEILSKFHNSINYDSQGHVRVSRSKNNQHGENALKSAWTKNWSKSISGFLRRASSSMSSRSNDDSFAVGEESFVTAQSNGLDFCSNPSFGFDASGSTSFQSARFSIPSAPTSSSTLPQSSIHSNASSAHRSATFVESQHTQLMAMSIAEEETDEDNSCRKSPPPQQTPTPSSIETGVRSSFQSFRRARQEQKRALANAQGDDDVRGSRLSLELFSTHDERSRRIHRPVRRTATDPTEEKPTRIRRPGRRSPKSSTPRRPSDMVPPPLQIKGVSWRRSPAVHVNLDSASSGEGEVESNDAMFSVGSSAASSNRRELMKLTKSGWKSSKKSAKSLMKGGKLFGTSIRNFASTFKDALKAETDDDWATALNESEILGQPSTIDAAAKDQDGGANNNHPLDVVDESWNESGLHAGAHSHEEEKEEIDAFEEHDDTFDQEHSLTYHDLANFDKTGSNRSLA